MVPSLRPGRSTLRSEEPRATGITPKVRVVTPCRATCPRFSMVPITMHRFHGTSFSGAVEMAEPATAEITICNDYRWIGDPRLGRFSVFVDGEELGRAEVASSFQTALPTGDHRIQVRLWRWYRSPELLCSLKAGQHLFLRADIDRTVSLPRRMGKMLVTPRRSLRLRLEERNNEDVSHGSIS